MWSLWCRIANELPLEGMELFLLLLVTLKNEKLLKIVTNLLKVYLKLMVSSKWPSEAENRRPTAHEVSGVLAGLSPSRGLC